MPALDRQPVRPRRRRCRRACRGCRHAPSRRPPRRRSRSTTSSCPCPSSSAAHRDHRARTSARGSAIPLVKLCVLIAAPLLVITTADAIVRIWRSAWAWMPVDRGKGLFRLAWVAVSIIGLAALVGGRRRRAARLGGGRLRARPRRPLDRSRVGSAASRLDGPHAQLLLELRRGAAVRRRSTARTAIGCRARRAATSPTSTRASSSRRSRSPTTARSSCFAAASSPGAAPGRSPAASSRSTRPSTRRPSARRWEETGLLVEPGEIIGLYTRLEAAVVTIAFEARVVGGTAAPTPRGARDRGLRARGDPVVRARLPDDDVDAARLARPPRRTSTSPAIGG